MLYDMLIDTEGERVLLSINLRNAGLSRLLYCRPSQSLECNGVHHKPTKGRQRKQRCPMKFVVQSSFWRTVLQEQRVRNTDSETL